MYNTLFMPLPLLLAILTLWILPLIRIVESKFEIWSIKAYFMVIWSLLINISILYNLIFLENNTEIKYYPVKNPSYQTIELIINQKNMLLIFFISIIFTLVMIYSIKYLKWETLLSDRGDYKLYYYILMMVSFIGIQIVIISNDAFTIFVGWELMVLPGYALIAIRPKKEASEAGIKYAIISTIGSIFLLYGITLLYQLTGTFNITMIHDILSKNPGYSSNVLVWQSIAFILIGIGVTAGFIGMHTWAPDVYGAAPSNVGAFISGSFALTSVISIYKLVLYIFDPSIFNYGEILIFGGLCVMTVGNLGALSQLDIRRFLGYSSISQRGYLLFGLGVVADYNNGNLSWINAVYAQAIAFLFLEGILFISFGNILFVYYQKMQTRNINQLKGSANKLHLTAFAIILASLGLSGLPPTFGFVTKFSIIIISATSGINILYFGIFILNSMLSIFYYINFAQKLVLQKPSSELKSMKESNTPLSIKFTMFTLVLFCIILSIKPSVWINAL